MVDRAPLSRNDISPAVSNAAEVTPGVSPALEQSGLVLQLQQEIQTHNKADAGQSLLGKAVDFIASPFLHDGNSLGTLNKLYDEARQANADPTKLAAIEKQASAALKNDKQSLSTRSEVEGYGSEFFKTGALFLGGRLGLASSVATYGLDQTKISDHGSAAAVDFGLGAAKAVGMRTLFKAVGATDWNFALKGMAIGGGSRALDIGLSRQTWTDGNGHFSLGQGVQTVEKTALSKDALGTDVLVFGTAGALGGAFNAAAGGAIERSPFLSTVMTGGTFGLTSGGLQEFQRQQNDHQPIDYGSILFHALAQGAIDGVAAAPGGAQAAARSSPMLDFSRSQSNQPALASGVAAFRSMPDFSGSKPLTTIGDASANVQANAGWTDITTPMQADTLRSLLPLIKAQPFYRTNVDVQSNAVRQAAGVGQFNSSVFTREFVRPLQQDISDPTRDYTWRTFMGSKLVDLENQGLIPQGETDLSQLEIQRVPLSVEKQTELRQQLEYALRNDNNQLRSLLGGGALGRTFPEVFGEFNTSGGIIGRPQHNGHDSDLGTHTLNAIENLRNHPELSTLSEKDQTDLLMAALFHDTAKRPWIIDPAHESNSAALARMVLRSLGYPEQRVQRITNLIPRHSEISYDPNVMTSQRLQDPAYLADVAAQYRKPDSLKQTRIFNESDIRAVYHDGKLWTNNVASELDRVTTIIQDKTEQLNKYAVPVLTSDVPQHFGLYAVNGEYSLLAQRGARPSAEWLRRTPVIESPHYNANATLVSRDGARLAPGLYPLLSATPERVSQAYNGTLGTTPDGWRGHVQAVEQWSNDPRAREFAQVTDRELARMGLGDGQPGNLSALTQFRRNISKYDTVDELYAKEGYDSILARANRLVSRRYQSAGSGDTANSQFVVNAPSVSGILIARGGRPVVLESAPGESPVGSNENLPPWLSYGLPNSQSLVIPRELWQEARRRDLPLVVVD